MEVALMLVMALVGGSTAKASPISPLLGTDSNLAELCAHTHWSLLSVCDDPSKYNNTVEINQNKAENTAEDDGGEDDPTKNSDTVDINDVAEKEGVEPTPAPTPNSTLPVPTPQPTVPTPQPTVLTPQPTMPTPQPTVPTPQPTVPTPQPTVPTPQPTVPTPQPTEECKVIFYEKSNYNGDTLVGRTGENPNVQGFNDKMSSFKINQVGCWVILYWDSNRGHPSQRLSLDFPEAKKIDPRGNWDWNDKMTGYKVGGEGKLCEVEFYEHENYRGAFHTTSGTSRKNVGSFNDKMSSFKIKTEGCWVVLYWHNNWDTPSQLLRGHVPQASQIDQRWNWNWDDKMTGFMVGAD